MKRRQLLLCAPALAVSALGAYASAQTTAPAFPIKLITVYVPYPAGGISDQQARTIAPHLSKALGQPVAVENLSGAGGSIAAQKMLALPADGHSLMVVSPNETILAPLTIAGLKYQAEDFRLLANGIAAPTALLMRATMEASNLDELLAIGVNKELRYGSVGVGSMPHLTAEDFRQRTGVRLLHVPYRGGAPMIQDMVAGHIDIAFMAFAGPLLGMVAVGKIKVIGLATVPRIPALSQFAVLGDNPLLRNFDYPVWSTFAASKAVPELTAAKLNQTFNEIMQLPQVQAWVKTTGSFVLEPLTLKSAANFYETETRKIRGLAKAVNLLAPGDS